MEFILYFFPTTNEIDYLCATEKEKSFSCRNFNRKIVNRKIVNITMILFSEPHPRA